jgi:glycerol transport system ATP-binding protein
MARIELRGIAHSYGPATSPERDYALKPLDQLWSEGGAYALLGPSGCGKTTLLNIISGLLRPMRGAVLVDGKDVTAASPQARNIAQVFQFPVVYDTMTVFENLAFPLRNRGLSRDQARARVEQIADLLELRSELGRKASGLPADMKQRISLGRGLVRTDVAAILLDEPLTVIDPHVKWLLRRKLMQIHAELRVTLVYVTHDQVEALTLADEVIVMNEGRVLQRGTPLELFERPAHTFVGYFIGSPGMNLLPCTIEGHCAVVEGRRLALGARCDRARARGGTMFVGARPEFLRLHARRPDSEENVVEAVVTAVENLGGHKIATARFGEQMVAIKLSEMDSVALGAACWVEFPPSWTMLYADEQAVT